jgi:hypothetical protein
MLTVKLEGFDELQRKLADAPRKLEIATQRALLKTANGIKEAETNEMKRVFQSPTRWTLGAMKVKATNKLTVEVGILDPDGYYKRAASYLGTQVGGGQRRVKAMEKALQSRGVMPTGWMAVPGQDAKMDANGNMSVGQIRQILSWFDVAENWAGSTQNMGAAGRAKKIKGTRKTAGFEYFAVAPGARRGYQSVSGKSGSHTMQPGIYSRTFLGHGSAIKPVLIFVKTARYQIRFNFERVALATADAMLNSEMNKAIEMELFK